MIHARCNTVCIIHGVPLFSQERGVVHTVLPRVSPLLTVQPNSEGSRLVGVAPENRESRLSRLSRADDGGQEEYKGENRPHFWGGGVVGR